MFLLEMLPWELVKEREISHPEEAGGFLGIEDLSFANCSIGLQLEWAGKTAALHSIHGYWAHIEAQQDLKWPWNRIYLKLFNLFSPSSIQSGRYVFLKMFYYIEI